MLTFTASTLFVIAGFLTLISILNTVCRSILAAPREIVPEASTANLSLALVLTISGLALIFLF